MSGEVDRRNRGVVLQLRVLAVMLKAAEGMVTLDERRCLLRDVLSHAPNDVDLRAAVLEFDFYVGTDPTRAAGFLRDWLDMREVIDRTRAEAVLASCARYEWMDRMDING